MDVRFNMLGRGGLTATRFVAVRRVAALVPRGEYVVDAVGLWCCTPR
jgi:hypothetical protein